MTKKLKIYCGRFAFSSICILSKHNVLSYELADACVVKSNVLKAISSMIAIFGLGKTRAKSRCQMPVRAG